MAENQGTEKSEYCNLCVIGKQVGDIRAEDIVHVLLPRCGIQLVAVIPRPKQVLQLVLKNEELCFDLERDGFPLKGKQVVTLQAPAGRHKMGQGCVFMTMSRDASVGEVRRLSIEESNVSCLEALVNVSASVCPDVRARKNIICWKVYSNSSGMHSPVVDTLFLWRLFGPIYPTSVEVSGRVLVQNVRRYDLYSLFHMTFCDILRALLKIAGSKKEENHSEGDYVTIASDPELSEAVSHAKDGLLTIYIKDQSAIRGNFQEAFVPKANFRKWLCRFLKHWHAKQNTSSSNEPCCVDATLEVKAGDDIVKEREDSDNDDVKDPHIENALAEMTKMGFTNEGDWLARLLEAKEGDINKTIETIRKNKKVAKAKREAVRELKKD